MTGLRERKKEATRTALQEAALRLALESGPENVRVDDIAAAAGVSPRTYNNYFSSREQAIVAAVTASRDAQIAADIAARPEGARLATVVTESIVEHYCDPHALVQSSPALRLAFRNAHGTLSLAAALAGHLRDSGGPTARVLAAAVAAAIGVALDDWLRSAGDTSVLVVTSGSLPDLLRASLAPLGPAFDAASR